MTVVESIATELETILAARQCAWLVAVEPPAGHAGPCAALSGWRLRFGSRSSLSEYPILEIDITVSGIDEAQAERARLVMRDLAKAEWISEGFTAINGSLRQFSVERDEGARQERWVATGTIEYQVQDIEE